MAHYTDNISGCGDSVVASISKEFFRILRRIIVMVKASRCPKTVGLLLDALIWNYKGNDLNHLAKFNIIEVLRNGDGERLHPIALHWGKAIKKGSLSTRIINLFEFLFK